MVLIATLVWGVPSTNEQAKEIALREFGHDPEMVRIIKCESNFRHFDENGDVLIGVTGDVGIMQIAPQYWKKEADKLGHDIYTVEGNIEMAKVIKDRQGKHAWMCHRPIAYK